MRRLVRVALLVIVWISVGAAVRGFVLPWAYLDVKYRKVTGTIDEVTQTVPLRDLLGKVAKKVGRVAVTVKHGAETVTGELPDFSKIPDKVSGADIPRLAHQHEMKVALALAEMFTGERELGAKSWLVYLMPGLAVVFGLLVTWGPRRRVLGLIVGAVSVALAGVLWWKFSTTNANTLLVAIAIGPGLWMSCGAYAGLGVSSIGLALADQQG